MSNDDRNLVYSRYVRERDVEIVRTHLYAAESWRASQKASGKKLPSMVHLVGPPLANSCVRWTMGLILAGDSCVPAQQTGCTW